MDFVQYVEFTTPRESVDKPINFLRFHVSISDEIYCTHPAFENTSVENILETV